MKMLNGVDIVDKGDGATDKWGIEKWVVYCKSQLGQGEMPYGISCGYNEVSEAKCTGCISEEKKAAGAVDR